MPLAVCLEFYGPNICPFCMMTDKALIEGDVSGKEKVLVTTTSEACAHLVYANCRDKWIADWKFLKKAGNKKAKIPTYKKLDPATHAHKNLWSNSQVGSITGGGWHLDAMTYFNDRIKDVQKFRENEAENGFPKYQMALVLLKVTNEMKMDDEQPEKANTKKQKRDNNQAKKSTADVKIIILDE
jgi:hypothetical protein